MTQLHCSGWWEQAGFGRQPMTGLELSFSNGRIQGRGTDIVGEFEMEGELTEDKISLRKHYIGKHSIDYRGTSVGEGAYTGTWSSCGFHGGNWFIGIVRSVGASGASMTDVQDIGSIKEGR